jgi:hypothetical protein
LLTPHVIANEVKQSIFRSEKQGRKMDCFAAAGGRNDEVGRPKPVTIGTLGEAVLSVVNPARVGHD